MVQGIENLTQLAGTIVARRPDPERPEYEVVTLDIDLPSPVEGKANLAAARAGSRIEVTTRRELLGAATEGARIQCRARRTPDGLMCEPHPDPGDFKIDNMPLSQQLPDNVSE
jgi:hypothetical protein